MSCGGQGPVRQLAMLIFLMLLVIFLVHPCCMLLHKTQNKHLDIAVHVIVVICSPHLVPRPKVYSLLLCTWHSSTTAYPFDSGASVRLWHVARKSIIELIKLWDFVWDFLRHLNISQHMFLVIKTSHHGGTQGDLKKMKIAMDNTKNWLNPEMNRPRLKESILYTYPLSAI